MILSLLASYGLTTILIESVVASPIRNWLTGKKAKYGTFSLQALNDLQIEDDAEPLTKMNIFFRMLLSCYMCTGWWVSAGVAIVSCLTGHSYFEYYAQYVQYVVEFAFAGSGFCLLCSTLQRKMNEPR